MRLNPYLASVLLSSVAVSAAEEEQKPIDVSIGRPAFTPTSVKAPFLEQFGDDWSSRWTPSHAKKADSKSEEDWTYVGEWAVEEPTVLNGMNGDKGLVVKDAAAHHAISSRFEKPINNKDNTLVVQYEVKLQKSLECGGAYMKLLQENAALHAEEFSNASPYVIMFGPDKCGSTNKVHFIFRHRNPLTGEYEEKHLTSPPSARLTALSTLYTLIVRPDQSFEILIDGQSEKNGSLLHDFAPSVNPPKEIDDPSDVKPKDWVEESHIPDPKATKPADWDEDAPFEIVDTEAEIPEDWLVDEPATIPDPEAEKPEDWNDEEDGDWIPPTVPNPKCEDVSGCGPWTQPLKKNPDYKGKWSPPLVENPDYKGPWAPRKIPNPKYFEDSTPSNFEPIGGIGFEIWTMQNDILFNNIYLGHSVEDAKKLKSETFDVKRPVEEALEKVQNEKQESAGASRWSSFREDPVGFIRKQIDLFVSLAKVDIWEASRLAPEVPATVVSLLLTTIGVVLLSVLSKNNAPAPASAAGAKKSAGGAKKEEKKDESKEEKKDNTAASQSGTEKDAATKRK